MVGRVPPVGLIACLGRMALIGVSSSSFDLADEGDQRGGILLVGVQRNGQVGKTRPAGGHGDAGEPSLKDNWSYGGIRITHQ